MSLNDSGMLCLKWNNHSSSFLKNISTIHAKERFCDATIACQGKYFPVHRFILSTCSEYFDEIFDRIKCQHPYIVFKDIEPREMELLLNYMYKGEVNVIQEKLPSLIKAAEALKIKGLAVPDDIPPSKDTLGRKRSCASSSPTSKRRLEERKKRALSDLNSSSDHSTADRRHGNSPVNSENISFCPSNNEETRVIKKEPADLYAEDGIEQNFNNFQMNDDLGSPSRWPAVGSREGKEFENFANIQIPASFIKTEQSDSKEDSYEESSSSWKDFPSGNLGLTASSEEVNSADNMSLQSTSSAGLVNLYERAPKKQGWMNPHKPFKKPGKSLPLTHRCPYCDYGSYWTTNVKKHVMLRHTGERPHSCPLCPKKFFVKKHLDFHVQCHSQEAQIRTGNSTATEDPVSV